MKPWTTLILGGYGNFGARIARALAGDAAAPHGMALLVAGRDASRANALAQTLGPAARGVALVGADGGADRRILGVFFLFSLALSYAPLWSRLGAR